MRNLENDYYAFLSDNLKKVGSKPEPISKILIRTHTVSRRHGKPEQAALMRPLLNAIVGKHCDWDESQCAHCFKGFLETYVVEERIIGRRIVYSRELLLAVCGYTEGYADMPTAAARRDKYATEHPENGKFVPCETWESREKYALKDMASMMCKDYVHDPSRLINVIANAISVDELKKLDLPELICTDKEISEAFTIRNLPHEHCSFIGRADVLENIEANFKKGVAVQILYGMGGIGKTQIALHYAHMCIGEHTAIAWIDAGSDEEIHNSCLMFMQKIDARLEDNTPKSAVRSMFRLYFEQNANWLIVFDNADYLDRETGDMREVLESYIPNGDGHILITTRCDADFLQAMRIPVDVFAPELAIAFLAGNTGLEIDENAEILVKKLGYLPLALDYAASYIKKNCTSYKEYLDEWLDFGMELFDIDNRRYAEQTVRKAFHITLDKFKKNAVAVDFLHRLACLNVTYLPLERYLEVIAKNQDAPFRDFTEVGRIDRTKSPDDKYYMFSVMIDRTTNGTTKLEDIKFEFGQKTIYKVGMVLAAQDALHDTLKNKRLRNELLQDLAEYSLIHWDKEVISIHTLLREIIYDEMTPEEKVMWYSEIKTPMMLSEMYRLHGDSEISYQREYVAICEGLRWIEDETKALQAFLENSKNLSMHEQRLESNGFIQREIIPFITKFFYQVFEYNDIELAKRAIRLRNQCMKAFYDAADISYWVLMLRRYDEDFFCRISGGIGRGLLCKSFYSPAERKEYGCEYYRTATPSYKYSKEKCYPDTDALRAVVDVWMDKNNGVDADVEMIDKLFCDIEKDCWIVALPSFD